MNEVYFSQIFCDGNMYMFGNRVIYHDILGFAYTGQLLIYNVYVHYNTHVYFMLYFIH